jgi:Ca2+/Na+ antiporter
VEKMRKSPSKFLQRWGEEAVAGATICALGCNGPELFSNLISLYTGSDAGLGVVVGSEIFNLLIIVGAAILAAPELPLPLERAPFTRDCAFYFLSIGLLYWALEDKMVTMKESCVLLSAAAVYVATVYFTTDLVAMLPGGKKESVVDSVDNEPGSPSSPNKGQTGKMHGIEVSVTEIFHSRMEDTHKPSDTHWDFDPTEHGIYTSSLDPAVMKMKSKKSEKVHRTSIGFQFDNPSTMIGNVLKYKDLKEVIVMEMGVMRLEFKSVFQHVTLEVTVDSQENRDKLLQSIEKYSLGRPYTHAYDATARGAFKNFAHEICNKNIGFLEKVLAIPEFLIDVLLRGTLWLVDVKDHTKQGRWPLCFLGAMSWLAVFSLAMILIADQIHYNIPALPVGFLGITVCAIGTSFPNAVASILMAQQNKPAAAIANALGSNVQNVFLAMALPWIIYGAQYGNIVQNVAGITEGVLWMLGTLVLVIIFVLMPQVCSLTKVQGLILVFVYIVYLTITSGEAFHAWPPMQQWR